MAHMGAPKEILSNSNVEGPFRKSNVALLIMYTELFVIQLVILQIFYADQDDIVFVENTTSGINAVLNLLLLKPR